MRRSELFVLTLAAMAAQTLPAAAETAVDATRARDVHLVDQNGAPFSLAQIGDAPLAVTFVATRCTDTCPIANAVFVRAAERIALEHVRARLVTVTLDPGFDTPFVMARLAQSYGAIAPRWRVASGRPADVHRLLDAFGVAHDAGTHGSFVYVLAPQARRARILPLSIGADGAIVAALRAATGGRAS